MKRLTIAFLLLLLVGLLVSCNEDKNTVVPKELNHSETEETELENELEEVFYENTFPLTGIGTNDEIDYRAFGVMIENTRSARPQSGVYQADLVYEVLSEATITRLLAFFHSEKPEVIGPVRSAREYYIQLNNGYNGIYVSAGGSPQAFAMFQKGQVDFISGLEYDGRYLWRSSARKAPHNLYTSFENLVKAAEHENHSLMIEPPALPFVDEGTVITGEQANEIRVNYGSDVNNVVYQYDEEQKNYTRIVGGEQSVDLETKNPVLINNIFIVEMNHRIVDDAGRREVDIFSGGDGFLIQNGVYQAVQWENVDGQILPVKDGEIVGFVKGKTWINVVPNLDLNVSIH